MKELCKAAAFVLTKVDSTTAGVALLCVDCRYASVLWPNAEGIDCRFGSPAEWAAIEHELQTGIPTTPLSPLMACAQVLADSTGARVEWVGWAKRVEVDDPSKTPAMLDALLSEAGELLWTRADIMLKTPAPPKKQKAGCNRDESQESPFVKLESNLTCPACGAVTVETMPVYYCQRFYDCPRCGTTISTKPGHCCVYCSHGDTPCPPKQTGWCCDAPKDQGVRSTDDDTA